MAPHTGSVTHEQIDTLLDFLDEHRDLARGRLRSVEGKVKAKRLWKGLCDTLNSMGGCTKTIQQWQKVWFDRKHLAKKASAVSGRPASATRNGSATTPQLTHWELRVLDILGEGSIQRQTGGRVTAFSESSDRIPTTSSEPSQHPSFPQPLSLDLSVDDAESSEDETSQPIQLSEPASQPVSQLTSGQSSQRPSTRRRQSAAGSDVRSRSFPYEEERAEETFRNAELAGIRAELTGIRAALLQLCGLARQYLNRN